MSIDVSLDPGTRQVTVVPHTQLDVEALTDLLRVLEAEAIDPSFDIRFELSDLPHAPSVITGLALGTFWIDHRARFQGRLAFVAPARLFARQGIAIMEVTAWLAGIETRVFDSPAACSWWLSLPREAAPAAAPTLGQVHLSRLG